MTFCAAVTVSLPDTAVPAPSLTIFTLPEQLIFAAAAIAGLLAFAVTVTSCAAVTVSVPATVMLPPLLAIVTLPEQSIFAAAAIVGL